MSISDTVAQSDLVKIDFLFFIMQFILFLVP